MLACAAAEETAVVEQKQPVTDNKALQRNLIKPWATEGFIEYAGVYTALKGDEPGIAKLVLTPFIDLNGNEMISVCRISAPDLMAEPVYTLLYASAIIFFCFFYTALVFNPKETADNLKKSGAFVPGIRPGDQTARYIEKITLRLTLVGAIYVTLVCLLPEILIVWKKVPFYFGGTSLLIIVVVTMDFMAQVQNYVMSQQYDSLLRKANFKGGIPTR